MLSFNCAATIKSELLLGPNRENSVALFSVAFHVLLPHLPGVAVLRLDAAGRGRSVLHVQQAGSRAGGLSDVWTDVEAVAFAGTVLFGRIRRAQVAGLLGILASDRVVFAVGRREDGVGVVAARHRVQSRVLGAVARVRVEE